MKGLGEAPLPLFAAAEARHNRSTAGAEADAQLPAMSLGEEVVEDYNSLKLSLKRHPLGLLRDVLDERGMVTAGRLPKIPQGRRISLSGLVLVRQRPGTAKGVIFATLEDETGVANIIVWPPIFERYRRVILGAKLLGVDGEVQREGIVIHVVAKRLVDLTPLLSRLTEPDVDFANALARADEVTRPGRDMRDLPVVSRNFH